ncbi:MAG: TIM barrel protein [Gallionella sp.]|jgi:mannonate dehydratase|nr:TIM barrel protein [Gallionella sp.]
MSGEGPKLGCQSGPSTDEHFTFLARFGVRHVCASPNILDPARVTPTVEEISRLRELVERHGISLEMTDSRLLRSTLIDAEKYPAIMLGDSPQRDRDIESFQQLLRNCAAVGIGTVKYNMSLLGVIRNRAEPGRGGVTYSGWKNDANGAGQHLTRAGIVDEDTYWDRIQYFLERVVPVANEYRIRIACHPHDPGLPSKGYRGVRCVLDSVSGLERFLSICESPYHGLNFCQGTICSQLDNPSAEIFDVIRSFGLRGKIFNVHIRNIRGHRGEFLETFPDDGDIDMVRAVSTYREIRYDGMLMPDHVPLLPVRGVTEAYAYNFGAESPLEDGHRESFAFAYGYLRGLLNATAAVV